MKEHNPAGSLNCYWSKLKDHPQCVHGNIRALDCLLFDIL